VAVDGMVAAMTGKGVGSDFRDFNAYLTGIQIGIDNVTLGGGIGKFDGFNTIDWEWNIGAIYEIGPFGVGAQYAWAKDINGNKSWAAGVGLTFTLAPGLLLQADYVHSDVNFKAAESVNVENIAILGIRIIF
jgi:hypothetical protein